MIIAVKTNTKRRMIVKAISVIALLGMFTAYYFHMSEQYAQEQKRLELQKIKENKEAAERRRTLKLEKMIYREIENAVDLIGQEFVINVRIISNKVIIVCDPGTNIEALVVRYGTMALVKRTIDDIKIAIDLKYIVKSNYNAK